MCIRLLWLGPKSAAFRNRIHRATIDALPDSKAVCTFTNRRMFNTWKKDVLPTESMSNIIHFFSCACEQSYVGRTAQRLEERNKQHIPASLISAAGSQKTKPEKKEQKKSKKNKRKTMAKTKRIRRANQGGDSADGGSQEKNVTSTVTEQDGDSTCANGENRKVLKVSKSDSGITRHLKTSSHCREAVCKSNITERFQVIVGFLEALFIGRHAPALCAQKEFVRTLGLFFFCSFFLVCEAWVFNLMLI